MRASLVRLEGRPSAPRKCCNRTSPRHGFASGHALGHPARILRQPAMSTRCCARGTSTKRQRPRCPHESSRTGHAPSQPLRRSVRLRFGHIAEANLFPRSDLHTLATPPMIAAAYTHTHLSAEDIIVGIDEPGSASTAPGDSPSASHQSELARAARMSSPRKQIESPPK